MAKVKPAYSVFDDFNKIAQQVIEAHSGEFGSIESSKIRCFFVTNKDRSSSQQHMFKIRPIKYPIRLDYNYNWYVIIHESDWNSLSENHQLLLVAQILCAIPNDITDEPETVSPDFTDYGKMVRTFGVDYMESGNPPNILEEKVSWTN